MQYFTVQHKICKWVRDLDKHKVFSILVASTQTVSWMLKINMNRGVCECKIKGKHLKCFMKREVEEFWVNILKDFLLSIII